MEGTDSRHPGLASGWIMKNNMLILLRIKKKTEHYVTAGPIAPAVLWNYPLNGTPSAG
jgi:hypothetical protein